MKHRFFRFFLPLAVILSLIPAMALTSYAADNGTYSVESTTKDDPRTLSEIVKAPEANALVYNGEPQPLVKAGEVNGGTMVYSLEQFGEYLPELPTGIDAGEYTVWYRIVGDDDHSSTEPQSITVILQKADPIIDPIPMACYTIYNGNPQILVTSGAVEGGELQYSLSENTEYSTMIPTGTEAGAYTVWYRVVGDSNHNDIAPQSILVMIYPNGIINPPDMPVIPIEPDESSEPSESSIPSEPSDPGNPGDHNGSTDPDATVNGMHDTQTPDGVPRTGDNTTVALWISLTCISGLAMILLLYGIKR